MIDRLTAMRTLVSAVDLGSLAAAARALRLSPAKATRLIAALEAQVGTPLLHRTTRRLRLSEAGEHYVEACRRALSEIDEADRRAIGDHGMVRGKLTLTAPIAAGTQILLPILDEFLDAHAQLAARVVLIDRVADLIDEGIDIALRIAHLPDSSLVAVRVGEIREIICAAPAYLEEAPRIDHPGDLRAHPAITLSQAGEGNVWKFPPANKGGRLQSVSLRPRLTVNTVDAALATTIAGNGVARLFSYQVADAIAGGKLVAILREHEPPPRPIHLVAPRANLASAKVRAIMDFAAPRLRERFKAIASTLGTETTAAWSPSTRPPSPAPGSIPRFGSSPC